MVGKRLGCGKSLGSCCSVVGCSMRTGTNLMSKIKNYSFPKERERLNAWILAVDRKNWSPKHGSIVCSRHFITGKPSKIKDHPDWAPSLFLGWNVTKEGNLNRFEEAERQQHLAKQTNKSFSYLSTSFEEKPLVVKDDPDQVQSLVLNRMIIEREKNLTDCDRAKRQQRLTDQPNKSSSYHSSVMEDNNTSYGSQTCHASSQTDLTMADLAEQEEEVEKLRKTVAALQNSMLLAASRRNV